MKNGFLNVYEMYVANGNRCGFWVARDSLDGMVMRVDLVGAKASGALEGEGPYFGNPKVKVSFFGEDGSVRPEYWGGFLPGAGTYKYQRVDVPPVVDVGEDRYDGAGVRSKELEEGIEFDPEVLGG